MRDITNEASRNASNHPGVKLMHVDIKHEIEGWWARSPDLARWTAAAGSYEELQVLMNEAAKLYGYDGWIGVMPGEPTLEVD